MSVCTPEGAVVVDANIVDYEKCPCWDEELVHFAAVAASYGGGEREDLVGLGTKLRVRWSMHVSYAVRREGRGAGQGHTFDCRPGTRGTYSST